MKTYPLRFLLVLGAVLATSTADAASVCGLGSRPKLPGLHPVEVELLEDSFLRKSVRRYGCSRMEAHEGIHARYRNGKGFLQGHMAEAMYIHGNRGWRYVASANATQNDAYTFVPGRRAPITAQVKFHQSGRPSDYARDMRADYLATRFVIPDDHVRETKAYLRQQARRAEMRGETQLASAYLRDYGRVRGMGVSSADVIEGTAKAARFSKAGLRNPYISFGAIVGSTLLPTLGAQPNEALEGLAVSFVDGIAVKTTDDLLKRSKPSALTRGKGASVVLGAVVTITNAAFLAQQYGFRNALRDENFYLELGGNTVGLAGGAMVGWGMTELLPATLVPSPMTLFAITALAGYGSVEGYWQMVKFYKTLQDPLYLHRDFLNDAEAFRRKCQERELRLKSVQDPEKRSLCEAT